MNEHSSRSHAIFTVTIEYSEKGVDGNQHVCMGKLHLVDLAVCIIKKNNYPQNEMTLVSFLYASQQIFFLSFLLLLHRVQRGNVKVELQISV